MFAPAELVVTAAGNVDHQAILSMIERNELLSGSGRTADAAALPLPSPQAPIVLENKPDLEQTHLIIATPFIGGRDPRRYAADLLANIIGGGTSSRLWQKVREERGLAYSVGAGATMFNDCGLFSVHAATSPEQVEEVLDIVLDEMRWIVRNGISAEELQLMKDQTRASVLLGLEDSAGRAASLAHSEMLHGRQISVEESLANLDAVNADEVQHLAEEFFRSETIAFAAIGDLSDISITRDRLSV
jgi:predicted Zn-dependent peptidase